MYQDLQGRTYSGIFRTTFTLWRKFHRGGIFLVASSTKLPLRVMREGWGIDQKLTYFLVISTYGFTQSGILRGILLALYHEKFHRLPRYPPQKFHRVRTRIAKAWSSTCASAAHPSTLCDRHATMTFLFKWHSFRSSHV